MCGGNLAISLLVHTLVFFMSPPAPRRLRRLLGNSHCPAPCTDLGAWRAKRQSATAARGAITGQPVLQYMTGRDNYRIQTCTLREASVEQLDWPVEFIRPRVLQTDAPPGSTALDATDRCSVSLFHLSELPPVHHRYHGLAAPTIQGLHPWRSSCLNESRLSCAAGQLTSLFP